MPRLPDIPCDDCGRVGPTAIKDNTQMCVVCLYGDDDVGNPVLTIANVAMLVQRVEALQARILELEEKVARTATPDRPAKKRKSVRRTKEITS